MQASGSLGPPRAGLVLTPPTLANYTRPRLHGPPCPINVAAEAAVAVADPAAAALQVFLRPGVLPPHLGADSARTLPPCLAT